MDQESMDTEYDVIVLGTGITECILSGLLSVDGKKVLHIDKQDHYGGESASVTLSQLYDKFKQKPISKEEREAKFGRDRDWNVDLIPKFLMANGELTNILVHTDVTRYVEFKQISGSYVFKQGKIYKVPANEMEAIGSSLMGIFEKRRMKKFLEWIGSYQEDDASTHQGLDLDKNTMDEVYTKFGLGSSTKEFIGHAMALWTNDEYLQQPARPTFERVLLYCQSFARYGKSPYLYPLYGLGELPQGFARLSAIYGGTYMLDTPIEKVEYDEDGKFKGVQTKLGNFHAPVVIADPTYFPEKCRSTGQRVIRAICILNHPVTNTNNADSLQIIIPQSQVDRKNDIYIAIVSDSHNVCAKGHYLAIISTIIETDKPHTELEPAFRLLNPIEEKFMGIAELFEPKDDGSKDNVYLSRSYDSSSHFESMTDDVKDLYFRVTGHPLVLKTRGDAQE
ncbi:GDI1 (YER136W) [Zygosaccharomyces parabailii]|uniref:Rab GDP dissociation inhibitor n=1 Tax=Zygosaccharomyces bailii (strain CLIB 213 / ATCC 58445 / CBS 680 / BCRC 21525 / NBRC 1098 / NCYC 1416 / NRRL Y-2227) TaxID=1333698 RepID=A0A8J2T847_ZYGB2|nr:GDI1 (YER136W) [Zygosaccharomyces parabailii]CDF90053.1 ZYBA0S05-07910g1_1 [Zygosaccharomyces bailii CLIB 213]CDH15258.1 Rab GDP-dissociation inhibitor [Zygosaccharomyces bailii ISA1307]SJM87287.1 Rab GDP-dissociation inhibitor [Zygosaccharomyces bailii]